MHAYITHIHTVGLATISSRLAKCHTTAHAHTQDADDRIEYKAADGSTKTMSKAELDAILRQQQQGGQPQVGPDGSLSKQKEGKATVEEVRRRKCVRSCVFSIVCTRHLCRPWSIVAVII